MEPRDVAIDELRGLSYVTDRRGNCVTIIGTDSRPCVGVGPKPEDIALNPRTGEVFVTNRGDNTVSVLRG